MATRKAAYEVHRDSDYLVSDTHDGASASTTLRNMDLDFRVCGVIADLYIENTTSGQNSLVATVAEHEITTDDAISWDNGDTFEIYKTGTKNSVISGTWTDRSRGWKITESGEVDQDGWLLEDKDLDDHGRKKVFGPNQPEKN